MRMQLCRTKFWKSFILSTKKWLSASLGKIWSILGESLEISPDTVPIRILQIYWQKQSAEPKFCIIHKNYIFVCDYISLSVCTIVACLTRASTWHSSLLQQCGESLGTTFWAIFLALQECGGWFNLKGAQTVTSQPEYGRTGLWYTCTDLDLGDVWNTGQVL